MIMFLFEDCIGNTLQRARVGSVLWYLDKPVSNSGRLKAMLQRAAADQGWSWQVQMHVSPDRALVEEHRIVASSDSWVLDRCRRWTSLAGQVIQQSALDAWVVDLRTGDPGPT